jgi:PAS domain-containing protein
VPELVGRTLGEIVMPELRDVLETAARRALAGEPSGMELPSVSGAIVSAEVVPHRDGEGEIAGVLISVRDVTEQRAAERATRAAEERFRFAFDHAPIGVALVSPEGRWLRVNGTLCEMIGYEEEELRERTFQDITHPDDLDADLEQARAMLSGAIACSSRPSPAGRRNCAAPTCSAGSAATSSACCCPTAAASTWRRS